MPHPYQITSESRHSRLFELIRQRNVAEDRCRRAPRPDAANTTDSLQFMLRAERSLHPDISAQARS